MTQETNNFDSNNDISLIDLITTIIRFKWVLITFTILGLSYGLYTELKKPSTIKNYQKNYTVDYYEVITPTQIRDYNTSISHTCKNIMIPNLSINHDMGQRLVSLSTNEENPETRSSLYKQALKLLEEKLPQDNLTLRILDLGETTISSSGRNIKKTIIYTLLGIILGSFLALLLDVIDNLRHDKDTMSKLGFKVA